jgi:hypothetical protein
MKKDEFDPLYYNDCEECGAKATSVADTELNTRKGWYCEHCTHFTQAIGRETVWRQSNVK